MFGQNEDYKDEFQRHHDDFSSDFSDDSDILDEQIQYNIDEGGNQSHNVKGEDNKAEVNNHNSQKKFSDKKNVQKKKYYKNNEYGTQGTQGSQGTQGNNFDNEYKPKGKMIRKKKFDYDYKQGENYYTGGKYNKQGNKYYTYEVEVHNDINKAQADQSNQSFKDKRTNEQINFKNKFDQFDMKNNYNNASQTVQSNNFDNTTPSNMNVNEFVNKLNFKAKEFVPKRKLY